MACRLRTPHFISPPLPRLSRSPPPWPSAKVTLAFVLILCLGPLAPTCLCTHVPPLLSVFHSTTTSSETLPDHLNYSNPSHRHVTLHCSAFSRTYDYTSAYLIVHCLSHWNVSSKTVALSVLFTLEPPVPRKVSGTWHITRGYLADEYTSRLDNECWMDKWVDGWLTVS